MVEVWSSVIHRVFNPASSVGAIRPSDTIVAYEIMSNSHGLTSTVTEPKVIELVALHRDHKYSITIYIYT